VDGNKHQMTGHSGGEVGSRRERRSGRTSKDGKNSFRVKIKSNTAWSAKKMQTVLNGECDTEGTDPQRRGHARKIGRGVIRREQQHLVRKA